MRKIALIATIAALLVSSSVAIAQQDEWKDKKFHFK